MFRANKCSRVELRLDTAALVLLVGEEKYAGKHDMAI